MDRLDDRKDRTRGMTRSELLKAAAVAAPGAQGTPEAGTEGALEYLGSRAAQEQPFCMVISLVNPHDVLFYPNTYYYVIPDALEELSAWLS